VTTNPRGHSTRRTLNHPPMSDVLSDDW
jgi:hypothetical protein